MNERDMAAASNNEGRGMLIVVSSPSGGGKGTLIRRALKAIPELGYSVSYTTRSRREGEVEGIHYHFVLPEVFAQMQAKGDFLETARVHGNFYGTAYSETERVLTRGRDVILEIDVQGAESVRRAVAEAVSVFILPPSFQVLAERLTARGSEQPPDLELRLRNARAEVERYREFDYVVLNDEVEAASQRLASIIIAERARRGRQEDLAQRVLTTFT
ncbi:MAG: guanylate kinase [Pyrinomonadaceae bacterium]